MSSLPTNDQITPSPLVFIIVYYIIRLYIVSFERIKRIARSVLDFFFKVQFLAFARPTLLSRDPDPRMLISTFWAPISLFWVHSLSITIIIDVCVAVLGEISSWSHHNQVEIRKLRRCKDLVLSFWFKHAYIVSNLLRYRLLPSIRHSQINRLICGRYTVESIVLLVVTCVINKNNKWRIFVYYKLDELMAYTKLFLSNQLAYRTW